MTKTEIITKYAEMFDVTKVEATERLNNAIEFVTEMLSSGEEIKISGFMTLGTKIRASKECRNPATGETMTTKEKRVPYAKFGKTLKDAVED